MSRERFFESLMFLSLWVKRHVIQSIRFTVQGQLVHKNSNYGKRNVTKRVGQKSPKKCHLLFK